MGNKREKRQYTPWKYGRMMLVIWLAITIIMSLSSIFQVYVVSDFIDAACDMSLNNNWNSSIFFTIIMLFVTVGIPWVGPHIIRLVRKKTELQFMELYRPVLLKHCAALKYEYVEDSKAWDTEKILNEEELGGRVLKNMVRSYIRSGKIQSVKNSWDNISLREVLEFITGEYPVKCCPGKILLLDSKTKEKKYYDTTGGSPAHFELDGDMVYTSSHNFVRFGAKGLVYLEPGVIDKFEIKDGSLQLVGSFSDAKGFRYTSHKIFHYNDHAYICVFGHPNRLMFIDAESMTLLYACDIEVNENECLTDMSRHMLPRFGGDEFVAIQVSECGESIVFVGPQNIYFFDFVSRHNNNVF